MLFSGWFCDQLSELAATSRVIICHRAWQPISGGVLLSRADSKVLALSPSVLICSRGVDVNTFHLDLTLVTFRSLLIFPHPAVAKRMVSAYYLFNSALFMQCLLQSRLPLGALHKPRVWPSNKQQLQEKLSFNSKKAVLFWGGGPAEGRRGKGWGEGEGKWKGQKQDNRHVQHTWNQLFQSP